MNKLMLNLIFKKLESKNTKLLISSLSFQIILAIIPAIISISSILIFFNISITSEYQFLLILINKKTIQNSLAFVFSFYIISKLFFSISSLKHPIKYSFILSITLTITTILFIALFSATYIITNTLLSVLLKLILILLISFFIFSFFANSTFKYNLVFSTAFSVASSTFIFIFNLVFSFLIQYENYYGFLAPFFTTVILIHYLIYLGALFFICAETFTKFSKIKFIKS